MVDKISNDSEDPSQNVCHYYNPRIRIIQSNYFHSFLFFGIFLFVTLFKCQAQPTVREKLIQITNAVHEVASDAKLVFATGDDLSLVGKSDTWIYVYKSEAKNRLYEYWYDEGKVVARSTISQSEEFTPTMGMEYLPDTWLDSDEVISIAESNGGSSFRTSHGNYAAIGISLTPAASGASDNVPLLYPFAAWKISYRAFDNYFDLLIDCQTGEILNSGKTTAKEIFSNINSIATEFAADAKAYKIWSPVVDLEGKSEEWNYEFHSVSQHITFMCVARRSRIKRDPASSPEYHEYSSSIDIPDGWMDSDSIIIAAESKGGENFRNTHPNSEINLFLFNNQPGVPIWAVTYQSPTGSEYYEINAINTEGLINTAQTRLAEILTMVKAYANDAELVFVYANLFDISYTGDGTWHYVFKSESQQQLYEFYSTLTGYVGLAEGVTGFFSVEDFLTRDSFPDSWKDIEEALIIAESSGGADFRQNYPDWGINVFLFVDRGNGNFNWEINYVSESAGQQLHFLIDATPKSTTEDWPKTYGGDGAEVGQWVQETNDRGFIISGYTYSFGQGMADTWLLKTDSLGNLEWDKTYGGTFNDYGRYVEVTEDNEYLIAHNSADDAGAYTGNLLLTYSNGTEKLGRGFNNGGSSEVYSIHKTIDGSYIVAGSSSTGDGEPSDFLLIKTDENGDEIWNKTYGDEGEDICESMQQVPDGGYILLGRTSSYGAGGFDFWLVKTNEDGNKIWDKTYGGDLDEEGGSLALTSDGGFILAGFTETFGAGGQDCYLVKTDENGDEEWIKTFGTQGNDVLSSVIQVTDGGYIMVGTTDQNGNKDVLVIKTDSVGNEIWTRIIGEEQSDIGRAICKTNDGNFVITGGTRNWGANGMDVLLFKIEDTGKLTYYSKLKKPENSSLLIYPNPFSTSTNIRFNVSHRDKYKIRIIDLTGKEIFVLLNRFLPVGQHEIVWNGQNQIGKNITPGVYFIELTCYGGRHVAKVIVE